MTESEKLSHLKVMSGEDDETVLRTFLELAGQKVISRAYPFHKNITQVPEKYEMNQIEIACYLINKQGAEGQVSHNENGINRTYESGGVPESMLIDIIPFAGGFS